MPALSDQNATVSDRIPDPDHPNPVVSWQSMFWGLLAIALNTLIQDAGTVCGLPDALRVVARTSPLICLADTIFLVIGFCFYVALGCSPSSAARRIWFPRFESREIEERTGIDKHRRLNLIILVLGVVPQTLKLFEIRGIPTTQAFAGFFLAAYAIPEILRTLAGGQYMQPHVFGQTIRDIQRYLDKIQRAFLIIAASSQAGVWIWIISKILPEPWTHISLGGRGPAEDAGGLALDRLFLLIYLPWFAFIFGLISAITFISIRVIVWTRSVVGLRVERWQREGIESPRIAHWTATILNPLMDAIVSVLAIPPTPSPDGDTFKYAVYGGFTVGSWGFMHLYDDPISRASTIHLPQIRIVGSIALISLGLTALHLVFRVTVMGSLGQIARRAFRLEGSMVEFMGMAWFLTNLLTCVLYYSAVFDATGTWAPQWVQKLP